MGLTRKGAPRNGAYSAVQKAAQPGYPSTTGRNHEVNQQAAAIQPRTRVAGKGAVSTVFMYIA